MGAKMMDFWIDPVGKNELNSAVYIMTGSTAN